MAQTSITDEARLVVGNLFDFASGLVEPNLRLGVTGLSRAGKTVFITALVHNLVNGGRLPVFDAMAEGRIADARLRPQPDDAVPRFDYESHVKALVGGDDRHWPASTRQVSELRVTIDYESASFFNRNFRPGRLHLDIVDYPGEWLLDLPLLNLSYAEWSKQALALSRAEPRAGLAAEWHAHLATLDPEAEDAELQAVESARLFTQYLRACRDERFSLSALPPGRFLMPGDLEGSPALTFAPLDLPDSARAKRGTLHAMMERRFEAYKSIVVKPFFRDHFARLDRQIVLVDALQALNAGPSALRDLETALADILATFRPGRASWLGRVLSRRVDRILFAATKADHLHHRSHDRLEAILRRLTSGAIERAEFAGAEVDVLALASVRSTREAQVRHQGELLDCIVGVPEKGQRVGHETFDGESEIAIFPGDLPEDPEAVFARAEGAMFDVPGPVSSAEAEAYRFIRFRPPRRERTAEGIKLSLPHIRLDRALDFLIGDHLE
ncbi:YcjX family protein [Lutibaculum baratangense]|uniref:Amino acid regulated cytosolic protein n=1 Tax=Lutibaculum baratangense AMV1 TaxID=631454 RepID=V4RUK5_9HYPH|nr:YcjX family protein [Lutibaculum baratangense]ESR26755.1 Amino acid regulated cytosolic protein [Lutibaculum baratangense AMV1]